MKATLLSLLYLLLSAFGHVCLAQNWAPFQVNKKILYSTPDSLGGMLVGKSLALIWFDTTEIQGNTKTYYRHDLNKLGVPPFGEPKSFTSLYGSNMILKNNVYQFNPQLEVFGGYPATDTIFYMPEAGIGSTIIESINWTGVVTEKISRIVNGQSDSVKKILLTYSGFGQTVGYIAEVSKQNGFLLLPDMFGQYLAPDEKRTYQYFGDYNSDYLGIKSFQMQSMPFMQGDVLKFISRHFMVFSSSISCIEDSIKRTFISFFGDSCWVTDSIKSTNCNSGYQFISSSTQKIKNEQLAYRKDTVIAHMPVSSCFQHYRGKSAFLTRDSLLFIGELPATLGMNDANGRNLLCTNLPLSMYSISGFSSGQSFSPISLTRNGVIHGPNVNIIFTSGKEILKSKISVYPNPGNEKIRMEGIKEPSVITLHNLQGKVIQEQAISTDSEIDVHLIPNGLYYLTIRSGNKQQSLKWVKE